MSRARANRIYFIFRSVAQAVKPPEPPFFFFLTINKKALLLMSEPTSSDLSPANALPASEIPNNGGNGRSEPSTRQTDQLAQMALDTPQAPETSEAASSNPQRVTLFMERPADNPPLADLVRRLVHE